MDIYIDSKVKNVSGKDTCQLQNNICLLDKEMKSKECKIKLASILSVHFISQKVK